jgi:uncharacterized protein (TIGR02996 family)
MREAFLADIVARPDDAFPRLAFADWLEEHGEYERAEFIRVQAELARLPPHATDPRRDELRQHEKVLLLDHVKTWTLALAPWLDPTKLYWSHAESAITGGLDGDKDPMTFRWRRGFVDTVTARCRKWLAHGPAMLAATPTVQEVRLSGKRPNFHLWQRLLYGRAEYDEMLPPELFDQLKGGRELANTQPEGGPGYVIGDTLTIVTRAYDSEADALSDLSQACLAYAKAPAPTARRPWWRL